MTAANPEFERRGAGAAAPTAVPEVDRSPAITAERFRHVLGHLATGVTVITASADGHPVGMAANSVVSVSLDPPLVLFCVARTSRTWPQLRAARNICINILAGHHVELTRQFSRSGIDRFAGVPWVHRLTGPGLCDAVGWLDCRLYQEHEAGDHTVAVVEVMGIEARPDVEPLVFFRGRYGTFADRLGEA